MVPLDLSRVCEPSRQMQEVVGVTSAPARSQDRNGASHRALAIELFNVLDVRLRNALSAAHATELMAWLCRPRLGATPAVPASSRGAPASGPPTIGCRCWSPKATGPVRRDLRDAEPAAARTPQHRRRSVYIAPTESYRRQLELAMESGALAVSAPIGPDPLLSELAMGRYAFAAMELLDDECEVDVDRSSKSPVAEARQAATT